MKKSNANNPVQLREWHSSRKEKGASTWLRIYQNISNYSYFIRQLVRLSFLKEFKRSYIGLLWLFILPIVSAIIWIILNGAGIIQPGDTGIAYPAYVLLSTSIWGFFIEMYKNTSNIFLSGGKMKLLARFPYEAFIVEKLIVQSLRFVIPFAINIIVLLLFGVRFTWLALLFPLTLLPLLILGLAIGLIVSIFRVLIDDLAIFTDQAMSFLMFLTPVVYAPDIQLGFLSQLIHYNPLTYLIGFSRDVLTKGSWYEPGIWAICVLFSFLLLLIAVRIFVIAEPRVIERLIN
ncbi:MAG: ABC transporter permease [Bacteroidota bacterium]